MEGRKEGRKENLWAPSSKRGDTPMFYKRKAILR